MTASTINSRFEVNISARVFHVCVLLNSSTY
nr:hypothetical protein RKYZRHPG_RKYZRHPG_CDS_0010 [uncultured phage]